MPPIGGCRNGDVLDSGGWAAAPHHDRVSGVVVGTGILGKSCPRTGGETRNATDAEREPWHGFAAVGAILASGLAEFAILKRHRHPRGIAMVFALLDSVILGVVLARPTPGSKARSRSP